MTEDYLRRQLEALTQEIRTMRGEQQVSAIQMAERLAKIETTQNSLEKRVDNNEAQKWKVAGVVLSFVLLAVLAATFAGGVDPQAVVTK